VDATIKERYVNSLYWAFTTMTTVGYGDIHPTNSLERCVVICNMLIAAAMFAYIINDIGTIVSRYNRLAVQYKEKMNYVNTFMKSK